MIEQRVMELKQIIAGSDGRNAADRRFERAVDELVNAVYDDIDQISCLPSRALFDLFVIKVLYVNRHSRDAGVIDYLGRLLDTCLYAQALFPVDESGRPRMLYFSDVATGRAPDGSARNTFEAYRGYADHALVLSGVFGASVPRRRPAARGPLRRRRAGTVDRGYYVTTGRAMYRMASRHRLAEETQERPTLEKLAEHFEVYADALSEMGERYLLGFDTNLIADKMLDSINEYRRSGSDRHLENARRYAALLPLDTARFPSFLPREQAH